MSYLNKRIYFASQFDNDWHNINDVEHILSENGKEAQIGKWTIDNEFRVDEEVDLYSLEEISNMTIEIIDLRKKTSDKLAILSNEIKNSNGI